MPTKESAFHKKHIYTVLLIIVKIFGNNNSKPALPQLKLSKNSAHFDRSLFVAAMVHTTIGSLLTAGCYWTSSVHLYFELNIMQLLSIACHAAPMINKMNACECRSEQRRGSASAPAVRQ